MNFSLKTAKIFKPKLTHRLVFVITGLSTGGAEMMLYKLLSRICRDRFDPVVLCLGDRGTLSDRIEALHIPVHSMDLTSTWRAIAKLWNILRLCHILKPDIIQGWMLHGNLFASVAGFFSRRPVVWGIRHSSPAMGSEKKMALLLDKLLGFVSAYPKKIVYNSQAGKDYHELIGYVSDQGIVIPNGFEPDIFIPLHQERVDVRKELGLPDNALLIGMVGRYHPVKDHFTFLQAAALLSKTRPNVKFILVGCGCDNWNHELISLIQQFNLEESVFLFGERQDIPRLTAALDIASLSS